MSYSKGDRPSALPRKLLQSRKVKTGSSWPTTYYSKVTTVPV